MERIFCVECPECGEKFCCDYELRYAGLELHCPYCAKLFKTDESPWIDDRE